MNNRPPNQNIPQKPSNGKETAKPNADATTRFAGISRPPPKKQGENPTMRKPTPPSRASVQPKGLQEMSARAAAQRKTPAAKPTNQETSVFRTDGKTAASPKEELSNTQILRKGLSEQQKENRKAPSKPETAAQEKPVMIGGFLFARRKQANTGCLRGALYFAVVALASLYLSVTAWGCVNDVLALTKSESLVTITVNEGYTIPEISEQLAEKGVITEKWLFTLYCSHSEAEEVIEPGTYEIRTNLDYHAIVRAMRQKTERSVVSVTIREGLNLDETITVLTEAGISSREALEQAIAEAELNYSFLEDVPMGAGRLEGFLYPDKYDFYTDETPRNILNRLVRNFDRKLSPSMRKYLEEKSIYDLQETLTIASMIQLEAANVAEMRDISSVIHNRLEKDSFQPKYLQIDATLVYLIGREREVTMADIVAAKDIVSPYNTYMYEGLPPGPLCSPSIDAIRAALYPSTTNYFYYALTDEGVHEFVNSSAEHERIKRNNPQTYPDYER